MYLSTSAAIFGQVFHLPPFHAQRYDRLLEPGAVARHGAGSRSPVGLNVCTRVRNGSVPRTEMGSV